MYKIISQKEIRILGVVHGARDWNPEAKGIQRPLKTFKNPNYHTP
jgi:hypothetical protein